MEGTWYLASVCCNSSSFVALLQVKLGEGTWWQELMMEWLNNSASINYRWLDDIDGILVFFEQLQQFVKVAEESGLLLVILPGQVHLYAKSDHKNQQKTTHKYMRVYVCKYASWAGFWCSKTLWFSGVSESKVNQTIPNMKHMDPPNLLSQHLSTRLITTVSWSIRTSHGNIRRTRFAARSHCSHRKQRSFCLENMTMWQ